MKKNIIRWILVFPVSFFICSIIFFITTIILYQLIMFLGLAGGMVNTFFFEGLANYISIFIGVITFIFISIISVPDYKKELLLSFNIILIPLFILSFRIFNLKSIIDSGIDFYAVFPWITFVLIAITINYIGRKYLIKKEEKENSFKKIMVFLYIIVILTSSFMFFIIISLLSQQGHPKGKDAAVKSQLASMKAQGELFHEINESYLSVCIAKQSENGFGGIAGPGLLKASSASSEVSKNIVIEKNITGSWNSTTCHDSNKAWAAEAPLSGSTTTLPRMYCVDSTGVSKEVNTNLQASSTLCPQE